MRTGSAPYTCVTWCKVDEVHRPHTPYANDKVQGEVQSGSGGLRLCSQTSKLRPLFPLTVKSFMHLDVSLNMPK